MSSPKIQLRFSVIAGMILLAAFSRCIPHIPNFSPLGAIGLFGAAHFSKKWQSFLIPVAATWLSDLFIMNVIYAQYYPTFTWLYPGWYWTFSSYLLITFAGIFILKKVTVSRVAVASFTSTAIFFLITNFACWPNNPLYPQNVGGLMVCYGAGVPFLKGTLMGDVFYSTILFRSFALLQRSYPVLKRSMV